MRITAGTHRSRRLFVPDLPGLRPAQDRVRAAVFSALGALVPEARVLDLFAGTGAYGIEALSRGAQSALFVEQDSLTCEALRQNLESLGYSFPVLSTPVEKWLPGAPAASFDIIFLDPPYDQTGAELSNWKVIQGIHRLLAPGGRVVWEHHASSRWSPPEPLRNVWHREYGRSSVTFLAAPVAR
ncbi:MAG: 16S rRNA (guanine(966)-N(2))-methyltransferase RsmD [Proteobacteria bacterium]|nr:16S rRNA (guanine(966)-N(2))-methyltransferase RsmD [Pseudomonadota bacterium]NBS06103.1 16S rRNA (guanine(966)-N(2))-methyltransferase RsmD [Verrucomicrobiota bacterium]NBS78731.1 16S rRNA (guanine(966)-N(2))-methyltransferase RsmD [bacterium]NBS49402.1 16S rRNA (guanine(966)-N(2))-methyltransferase RsmD [Verrucomicrobiota bacterium]NBT23288.1 16S rRNA (guanine(966)-N(2))-methyltransferase RsmD [bacterium]